MPQSPTQADEPAADDHAVEAERQRVLEAIAQGMAYSEAGRVLTHDEVVARMRARFAERSK